MTIPSQCARCKIPLKEKCCQVENGRGPAFCPTINFSHLIEPVLAQYEQPDKKEFARLASVQEAECYANRGPEPYVLQPQKSRLQETIEFAHKLSCKRLGLAFCRGLHYEARLLVDVLEANGFEVASVRCNVGRVYKEAIGIQASEKVRIGTQETMCNPLMQAEVLNHAETDLNIVLGLCVGHDSLFLKQSSAFCTVLAVKDRVTGHNPMAALYTSHSYYQKLKHPDRSQDS